MPEAFHILFGASFTALVSLALGKLLLRRLRLRLYRIEEHLLGFVAGSACLSALVFALAATRLVYKGVLLATGALILAVAVRQGVHRGRGESFPPLPRWWRGMFVAAFAVFGIFYFFHAMAPEMSPDGSGYHLSIVARHARERGFHQITTNMYANLSQGVELLYLFAFVFGRHSAAALVHFSFLIVLPLEMLSYARRFGFTKAGVAGALFVFVSPVVGIDGSSAYNDVAAATILFTLFYLLQIWDQARTPGLLVAIGLVAGFGYAAKYTAFLGVPYALGFVAWKLFRARRPLLGPVAVVSLCAAAMIAPWMVKNWILLANPVSPFLNKVFSNPYVHVSFEEDYARHMRNYEGLANHWQIPVEVTVRGGVLCGLLGPLFLLAPVALVALRRAQGRSLLLAGLVFGLPYAANIGTRFLIPALPYLALAMALAFANARGCLAVLVVAHAVISWPSVLKQYCAPHAWRLDRILVRQAFRLESQDSWLSRKWPPYLAARMIEKHVPPGGQVLAFYGISDSYTTRTVRIAYQAASNSVLGEILWTPLIGDYQPRHRREFRFPTEALRKVRVVQTASGGPDQWSISEFRVFHGLNELPRADHWRLRAHPNPWEVQLAFDNSPVTRWKSWQTLFSGMFLEIDFGGTQTVSAVVLECSTDQYKTRMRLEAMDASGAWKALAGEPAASEAEPHLRLRRAATEEIKAQGVGYLLVHESDFGAQDMLTKTEAWGITPLEESYGFRLYRID